LDRDLIWTEIHVVMDLIAAGNRLKLCTVIPFGRCMMVERGADIE